MTAFLVSDKFVVIGSQRSELKDSTVAVSVDI